MFERSTFDIRRLVAQARREARALGSPRIEAEHLLLALAASPNVAAGQLLASEGLKHEAVRRALDLEFERSLAAADIWLEGLSLLEARLPVMGQLPLAHSAKLALQRALKVRSARHERRLDSLHILLGILSSELGTVARALGAAEVDRGALAAAARAELDRVA